LDQFGEHPIACLAILGDSNPVWKPQSYANGFLNMQVTFDFGVVKLLDFADRLAELERDPNPFARFVVAHLKTLALRYHRAMTRFEEEKEMPHLSTAEQIGQQIGEQIGRKIGHEEGRRDLLLDQLTVKFGPLPEEIIARVNALETAEIDRIGRAILTAQTLQELNL